MVPIPLALLGYMAYLGYQFGDPMAFLNAQSGWDRSLMAPWDTIGRFLEGPFELNSGPHSLVDFAFMLLAAVLAIASWKVLRRSYAVYITALVAVPAADRLAGLVPALRAHLLPDVPGAGHRRVAARCSTGPSSSRAWASAPCSWRCTRAGTGWPEPRIATSRGPASRTVPSQRAAVGKCRAPAAPLAISRGRS